MIGPRAIPGGRCRGHEMIFHRLVEYRDWGYPQNRK
ncbi:toxin HicA [Propionibacterium sp. NM47_B9-13]|nr:toxin HicA [Cutibacterium modestum]TGY28371.1 toxin HicA [Propionibacterium sp. NM47_B9-13]